MEPVKFTEEELKRAVVEVPEKRHGLFIDRSGTVYPSGMEVVGYLGRTKAKHYWAVKCVCGTVFKSYRPGERTCGCRNRETSKERMNGNSLGSLNKNVNGTIEKLKLSKPTYKILSTSKGGVMDKWDFVCEKCNHYFSARPDNLIGKRDVCDSGQTPCLCREPVYGGYRRDKTGILYVLKYPDYCKFGITGDLDRRKRTLDKSHGHVSDIELFMYFDGDKIYKIESLLKSLDLQVYDTENNVDGRTECRSLSDMPLLIETALSTIGEDI